MMICAKVTQGKVVVLLQVSLLLICFVLDCLCDPEGHLKKLNNNNNQDNDPNLRTTISTNLEPQDEKYYSDIDQKLANFHWKATNSRGQIEQEQLRNEAKNEEQNDASDQHKHQIHKHMSKRDLRRTFQVDSHDQVPEYEILTVNPTTRTSHQNSHSINKRSTSKQEQLLANDDKLFKQNDNNDDKLIVMELPIFGQDYKLRLKRNIEFQQKIHNMPMFMAETTKDGHLRYTEVKQKVANSSNNDSRHTKQQDKVAANLEPIGSTYHDEQNLAALLIDQDTRTGHFRVDGTIGNDFVIKPMPQSAIEALEAAQRKQRMKQDAAAAKVDTTNHTSNNGQSASGTKTKTAHVAQSPAPGQKALMSNVNSDLQRVENNNFKRDIWSVSADILSGNSQASKSVQGSQLSHFLHDDDEMFLDEDEAIEMAHQNHQRNQTSLPQDESQPKKSSKLNKVASERKYRKYRKFMAQTRVPKASEQESAEARSGRAKRHSEHQKEPAQVQMAHHIVYRQKASESEEKWGAPQETAEERLATRLLVAQDQTDRLQDPLGGQFYLEPAMLFKEGSQASWLLGSRGQHLNGTSEIGPKRAANASGAHARHKRHVASASFHGLGPAQRNGQRASQMRGSPSQLRRKRQAPDTVYPEVLLVVDYDSFLLHGGDSRDVKRYFVSFWNGVDLRYKLLAHPNIRISLAGMIVAKDRDATPYLERNRLRSPNADAVDAAGALTDMGKYLYREDRLPTYDLAVVITKLDMCRRRFDGGRCNRGTAGFAYVGGACVVNKRLEKVNSVAIIEDSGGFSGIIVAAHEVGHLLGCVHDGSPPPNYLGGPGATHCPWEDGFIMSDLRHTERGFRWSHCSVDQFKHFLHGETATCLYNYPHESQMLHRLLPGTMLSLDEQCK